MIKLSICYSEYVRVSTICLVSDTNVFYSKLNRQRLRSLTKYNKTINFITWYVNRSIIKHHLYLFPSRIFLKTKYHKYMCVIIIALNSPFLHFNTITEINTAVEGQKAVSFFGFAEQSKSRLLPFSKHIFKAVSNVMSIFSNITNCTQI